MEYPKISIIIPTYNRAYFLRNAIESVLNQNYPDLEILIVDGGSSDNTAQTIQEFISSYPGQIKAFSNHRQQGAPGAKNTGLQHIQGELFTILDDDDILIKDAIKHLVGIYLENNKEFGIVLGNRLRSDNHEFSGSGIKESREVKAKEFWYGALSGKFFGLFKSELIGKDRFDEDLKGGDRIFWNKMYGKSRIYYTHKPLRIYNIHSDSLSASLSYEPLLEAKNYEKEICFLEKLQERDPQKNNHLANLHNKLCKLYLAGNEKFKAREHVKKSLDCKFNLTAFTFWLKSLA